METVKSTKDTTKKEEKYVEKVQRSFMTFCRECGVQFIANTDTCPVCGTNRYDGCST